MKTIQFKPLGLVMALLLTCSVAAVYAGKTSDKTARYYLAQTATFSNQVIRLDVTHLVPFNPVRQVEGVQFYWAHTFDDEQNVPGGWIPVAAPSNLAAAMVKKYGTAFDFDGHPRARDVETEELRGKLVLIGQRLWIVDLTTGLSAILKDMRLELGAPPEGGYPGVGGPGYPGGPGGPGGPGRPGHRPYHR